MVPLYDENNPQQIRRPKASGEAGFCATKTAFSPLSPCIRRVATYNSIKVDVSL
jgi:hypothetical protein